MKKDEKPIELNSEAFDIVVKSVVSEFAPGELITHDYLKDKFCIKEPDMSEFDNVTSLFQAGSILQFTYMSLVDKLRNDILQDHNYYLCNIRGDGYILLHPKDQAEYAYKTAVKSIKDAMRNALEIIKHIRHNDVPPEQRSKDNDLLAKLSMFKQIADSALRKRGNSI